MICHACEDEDSKDRIARTERVCAETLGRIRQEKALLRADLAAARAQIEALTKERDEAKHEAATVAFCFGLVSAERDRYRAALDNAAATIERYCENCDKDHLADCRFCRDYGRDACPNDVRDDFLDMRNAADGARRALAGEEETK